MDIDEILEVAALVVTGLGIVGSFAALYRAGRETRRLQEIRAEREHREPHLPLYPAGYATTEPPHTATHAKAAS